MSQRDADLSFVAGALPVFVSEAREQCDHLEQLLLELEDLPGDRALLDALFRCAHTVKGSAGIFGLDRVVEFTHQIESLLHRLRDGSVSLTPELSTLLLECNDALRGLIGAAEAARADENDEGVALRAQLVERLRQARGLDGAGVVEAAAKPAADSRRWHISARFGAETFRNGNDPLALLAYLRGLGKMPRLVCDSTAIPPIETLDPESCYLGFELSLETDAKRAEIESAFGFVRDDCVLHLLEPGAQVPDFVALIEAMPEWPRLGEMLVSVGAITHAQLGMALGSQATAAGQGRAAPLGEILQAQCGVSPTVVAAVLKKQQTQRERGPAGPAVAAEDNLFIRVQADRLDEVINLLGELVISSAGAAQLARQTRQGTLIAANQQIGRLIEQIRNGMLQLRMVPIGGTFARFRRVVRDTAAELGKEVQLDIEGGETELDKSMVERIADPLMHLVRNALDHGLETQAERLAAGKPAHGRLTLSACHESGSILIRISDDGRGIQRRKVLQRAWERGLVNAGVVPPDAEIDRLIFAAGFSTAETVTNLSGRGVGMDVVRRNIEALRGSVSIRSVEGEGCTIEIRLPLTLAIIDGFLVAVGTSKFVFPLESVVEVIENRTSASTLEANGRTVVALRGQVLPVASLRRLYVLEGTDPERMSIVVLTDGTRRFGVMVDTLLGQHQTVIKPLGRMFRSLRGISGSSILGHGEVALIFDVAALSQLAAEVPGDKAPLRSGSESAGTDNRPQSPSLVGETS